MSLAADSRLPGLDHVQIRSRTAMRKSADNIAATRPDLPRKRALGRRGGRAQDGTLTPTVIHRANIARVGRVFTMALEMGAARVADRTWQRYGWALKNRGPHLCDLEPGRARGRTRQGDARPAHGRIVIDEGWVVHDNDARFPKPASAVGPPLLTDTSDGE